VVRICRYDIQDRNNIRNGIINRMKCKSIGTSTDVYIDISSHSIIKKTIQKTTEIFKELSNDITMRIAYDNIRSDTNQSTNE